MTKKIKFEFSLTNKWFYSILAFGVLLVFGVSVWAYNSDMFQGNPQQMGHSGGEINVEINGEVINLQDALRLNCVYVNSSGEKVSCPDDYIVVGGGYSDVSDKQDDTDENRPLKNLSGWEIEDEGETITHAVCCKLGP